MLQRTDDLKKGYMQNGTLHAANRRIVRTWRENNLERRKEQERAAWHRRKAKVKAQKLAALEQALTNTLNALS
ncbi:DNA-directed RNA polymerase [Escherichia phage vB_Eco_D226]|uniref:DNA-directed RNA polymerase n=1 Tax=Escherichia phage vB_Eco_D226 TaxID=2591402 RepID=A0A514A6W4_9CAUD|nr:DNA-directed RNA polymerase [Escherichia phage vB_Eco_D226]